VVDFVDPTSVATTARFKHTFRFLDTIFTVGTNRPEVLIYFQKMYPDPDFYLRAFEEKNDDHQGLEAQEESSYQDGASYYVIDEPKIWEKPFIWTKERIYPCPVTHLLPSYAYSIITNSIVASIQSHLIFHAAALSWQDQGIMILGVSGQGKSTLTLELIRRGFHFLTDDMTCINRQNRCISSVHRALSLRRSAVELFKDFFHQVDTNSGGENLGGRKIWLNLVDIPEAKIAKPCRLRFLLCLSYQPAGSSPRQESFVDEEGSRLEDLSTEDKKFFYFSIDQFEERMINEVRALPGVEKCSLYAETPFPTFRLIGRRGHFLLPAIEELCQKYRVALVNIARDGQAAVDYSQNPCLERISKSTAIRELVRSFRGGWRSPVLREANSGVASMLLELGQIIKGVDCYRIIPGRLEKMADLIFDLVNGDRGCL